MSPDLNNFPSSLSAGLPFTLCLRSIPFTCSSHLPPLLAFCYSVLNTSFISSHSPPHGSLAAFTPQLHASSFLPSQQALFNMAIRSFYSKPRQEHVLEVFHNGKVRDLQLTLPSPGDGGRNGSKDYLFRRRSVVRTGQTGVWNESSEDEYNPDVKRKRRTVGIGGNGAKPLKRQCVKQNITDKAQHEATVEEGGRIPSLVTFKFKDAQSKATLRDLADEHGNGYNATAREGPSLVEETGRLRDVPPHERDMQFRSMRGPTYFEKMDQQSANIDNVDGRVLRSRKILYREGNDQQSQTNNINSPIENELDISVSDSEAPIEGTQHTILSGERPAVASLPTAAQIIRSSVTTPQYPLIRQVGSSRTNPITLVDSPPGSPESSGPAATLTQLTSSRTTRPILLDSPPRAPVSSGPTATLKQITSCWAHPINFRHLKSAGDDCDFCRDFRFGIYGHGRITVEVIQRPGSAALEETGNGHRSTGKPATRMCVPCSLARMSISRCRVHRFKAMKLLQSKERDERYVQDILAEKWDPPRRASAYPTCSLCSVFSRWECCVDQQHDTAFRPLADGAGRGMGCGLRLCDTCHTKVMSCGSMLRKGSIMQPDGRGLRADVEFLFSDSLLHQAYGKPASNASLPLLTLSQVNARVRE